MYQNTCEPVCFKLGMMLNTTEVLFCLDLFCTSNIVGRELCWHDFIKYTIKIVMCQDTCEPICFRLGVVLNTTKLYHLIPVWMTLMVTQGHRLTGRVEFVQSFCCKGTWNNSNVHGGWLFKEDDFEEVLNVWWIWIVWAFALLVCPYDYHMDLISVQFIWSARWAAVCSSIYCGKNFCTGHSVQTFQPILSVPAILIGTIDFNILYHFQWPWTRLGVSRSVLSKTCWVHFLTYFSTNFDKIWCSKEAISINHPDFNFWWDLCT